jgi:hypothetical protein
LAKICSLVLLAGVTCLNASAQGFENIRAVQEGTRLIITYDLVGDSVDASYTVTLHSSHNNFTTSVTILVGEAGKGQRAGRNKRMEWDMAGDMKSFSGQVVVELVGIPELTFKKAFISPAAKAGKETKIAWSGGSSSNVNINLYRAGALVSSLGEKKNTGSFTWKVPNDTQTGDGFTIKLTAGGEQIESSQFSIKKKPPILIIAGSAVAVSGIVIWLWLANKQLPEAPDPN